MKDMLIKTVCEFFVESLFINYFKVSDLTAWEVNGSLDTT